MSANIDSVDLLARLQKRGPEALTDAELLAVVLVVPVGKVADMVRDASDTMTQPMTGRGAVRFGARVAALNEYAKRSRNTDPRPVIDGARAVAGIIRQASGRRRRRTS